MRLHRLTLRDVKGVRERTVTFPDQGVVVVEGPNEVGKSTLLEAFDRLLDPRAKATSKSGPVRALQPIGQDVGPFVEAEFTVGAHRLRFAKRWLREPMTSLEVLEPAPEQLTGAVAQQRLDTILAGQLDRPLWDALRFAQASGLSQPGLADSDVLNAALDGASGAALHSDDGSELLEQVEVEYLRYWTPTGRVTGELRESRERVERAREDAVAAHGELLDAQRLLESLERARAQHDDLVALRPRLVQEADDAREDAEQLAELLRARDDALARLRAAKEGYQRAQAEHRERDRLVADVESAVAAEAELSPRVEQRRGLLATARAASEEAARRADDARQRADHARDVADRAAEDLAHVERVEQVAAMADRVATVADLLARRDEAREELAAVSVTAAGLRRAEELATRLTVLQERHACASPSVLMRSLTGEQLLVVDDDGVVLPAGGEPVLRQVLADLTVEVPGLLQLQVRPDSGATERQAHVDAVRKELDGLLQGWAVVDLDHARAQAERADRAARAVQRLGERLADILGGDDPVALAARVEDLQEQVEAYAAGRDANPPLPADVVRARAVVRSADQRARELERAASQDERSCREAERAVAAAAGALAGGEASLEATRGGRRRAEERLAETRAAVPDAALQESVGRRAREFAQLEATAGVARRAVEAYDAPAVQQRLARALDALDAHDRLTREVHGALLSTRGQVELVCAEGRQEVYDLAVVRADEAYDRFRSVLRRGRAARRLRATLLRHRDLAHRAYVRPYREQLERLGRQVYGESFGVQVSPSLQIESRTLDGTTVPFEELSGGAREQLGILARLAVAALVDPDQGVPVVIDDALGYTDPERLRRVGQVFAGPAQRTQVILLTCTPQRYAGIDHGGHTTIRLTA